jgi:hypothetical protein
MNSPRDIAEIELDKEFTPKGTKGSAIGIPRNAFPASREFRLKSTDRSWGFSSGHKDVFHQETQVLDESDDGEDIVFLLSDDEGASRAPPQKEKGSWGWKGKGKGKRVDEVVIQ